MLAAVVVFVIAFPFVKRRRSDASINQTSIGSADALRHLLYREPLTLRNEFESGNITAEEYQTQLEELRRTAAVMMRDRASSRRRMLGTELEIEREVRRIRAERTNSDSDTRE